MVSLGSWDSPRHLRLKGLSKVASHASSFLATDLVTGDITDKNNNASRGQEDKYSCVDDVFSMRALRYLFVASNWEGAVAAFACLVGSSGVGRGIGIGF